MPRRPRKSRVVDRDRGYKQLMRRIGRGSAGRLDIGIQAREARRRYPSGVTVGQVALWQEQGTRTSPRRPFLTGWLDLNQRRLEREVRAVLERNLRAGDVKARLDRMANEARRGVLTAFWRLRPLARSTVESKGSSKPLVDTGLLERSISGVASLQTARYVVGQGLQRARGALGRLFGLGRS